MAVIGKNKDRGVFRERNEVQPSEILTDKQSEESIQTGSTGSQKSEVYEE